MVAAMLGLLLAIRLLISPDFSMLAALFVFWLPWERAPVIGQRTSPMPESLSTT
jgi:hypothetical protein